MNLTQEQAADCYAIRSLMNKVGFTGYDVSILQAVMQQLGADEARHLPWPKRVYNLDGCLATGTSDGGTARGSPGGAPSADDCVLHRDAANAILDETRDGRTIKGLYAAANRCARDVTCTFTIEIGTLPEADIAIDSWSHFRAQKTRTEEHILKAGAEMEFRFDETISNVPISESVDFRVLTAADRHVTSGDERESTLLFPAGGDGRGIPAPRRRRDERRQARKSAEHGVGRPGDRTRKLDSRGMKPLRGGTA
jgi:hypothetical protein